MLGLEAYSAPPGALSTIGLWAFLQRHGLATELLAARETEDVLMWRCVGALVLIGIALRAISLVLVVVVAAGSDREANRGLALAMMMGPVSTVRAVLKRLSLVCHSCQSVMRRFRGVASNRRRDVVE